MLALFLLLVLFWLGLQSFFIVSPVHDTPPIIRLYRVFSFFFFFLLCRQTFLRVSARLFPFIVHHCWGAISVIGVEREGGRGNKEQHRKTVHIAKGFCLGLFLLLGWNHGLFFISVVEFKAGFYLPYYAFGNYFFLGRVERNGTFCRVCCSLESPVSFFFFLLFLFWFALGFCALQWYYKCLLGGGILGVVFHFGSIDRQE